MAHWTDIAEWAGPTPNVGGPMVEYRGLVLHIMQGSYDGSIAWGKNPASGVSFHFATRADGHLGQLVDTATTAWTQVAGNGHWLSVENEGFSGDLLTPGQVEACAHLYARGVREYGWPLQTTDSTAGHGLGWHGMGGAAWGGHYDCPGEPIKAQRAGILARAEQILKGEDDMDGRQNNLLENTARLLSAMSAGLDSAGQVNPDTGVAVTVDLRPYWARIAREVATTGGSGTGPAGPVDLTPAAVKAVAVATADEIAADPERDGPDA